MNSTKNGDLKKSRKKNYISYLVKNIHRKFWKKKRFSNHTAIKMIKKYSKGIFQFVAKAKVG